MTNEELFEFVKERNKNWQELINQHFHSLSEIELIVLKGHLLVEQHFNAILSHYCFSPSYLEEARLQFSQKVGLVKAIVMFPFPDQFWNFVTVLNQLRNDYAHSLTPKNVEKHMAAAVELSKPVREGTDAKFAAIFQTEEGKLKMLISYWLGAMGAQDAFILAFEELRKRNEHKAVANDE